MAREIKLFGLTFKPMTEEDYLGFAGAEEGSYICYGEMDDASVYILNLPTAQDNSCGRITIVNPDGSETVWAGVER